MSTERDLAHEADMEELRREQLRADVDLDEANDYVDDIDYDDERYMLDQEQPD